MAVHWSWSIFLQWQPQFSWSHSLLWAQICGAVSHLQAQVLSFQLWVAKLHCDPSSLHSHLQWCAFQSCFSGLHSLAVWIQSHLQWVWSYNFIFLKYHCWWIISKISTSWTSCAETAQCWASCNEQLPPQRWRMTKLGYTEVPNTLGISIIVGLGAQVASIGIYGMLFTVNETYSNKPAIGSNLQRGTTGNELNN